MMNTEEGNRVTEHRRCDGNRSTVELVTELCNDRGWAARRYVLVATGSTKVLDSSEVARHAKTNPWARHGTATKEHRNC
ncbi:unnamed protein product [Soboliphyme baturini]|uniref:DUF2188 domain-containing protein n=1 Tax=Soboliphyme baturini TaxID=241478 RepID=A0A183J3S0_9BILA|nr:unnamed protein product [Soboliphyme baturini]